MHTTFRQVARQVMLGLLSLGCVVVLLLGVGCGSYKDRVIFELGEDSSFPCLGISRFVFSMKASEDDPNKVERDTRIEGLAPAQLFWDTTTKKCRLPNDVPYKGIEFGGERQMLVTGLDSSGRVVANGVSETFAFEATRGETPLIRVELKRASDVRHGTLLLKWSGSLPKGTNALEVVFEPHNAEGTNLPKSTLTISLNSTTQNFAVLTGIPSASGRKFVVNALNGKQQISTSKPLLYEVRDGSLSKAISLISVVFPGS